MKTLFSLLICASIIGLGGQFATADIVVADSEFFDADWNVTTIFQQSSTNQSQQIASGGNPGPFRQTTHTLNPNTSQERIAVLYHGLPQRLTIH